MRSSAMRILALVLVLALLSGCAPLAKAPTVNGTKLSKFTVIYDAAAPEYCQRAAEYIGAQILERTGIEIPVCEAASGTYEHEIVVGETHRPISQPLNADTTGTAFALLADAGGNMCFALKNKKEKQKKKKKVPISRVGCILD